MSIQTNQYPYFDDFNESKGFYQILFRPGYPVQARELTQLQTIIKNQIKRFGSHIFDEGSIVYGADSHLSYGNYIDVIIPSLYTITNFENYIGSVISGVTSEALGKIVAIEPTDTTNTIRVYFNYVSQAEFVSGESLAIEGNSAVISVSSVENYTGSISIFGITDSVFFVKGNFVFCNAQKIYIPGNLSQSDISIGLGIEEAIITSADDASLFDNARGFNNYAAPGADRYTINLTLKTVPLNGVTSELDPLFSDNFIELTRIVGGVIVKRITKANYSELENELARRTYDESGDYTVKYFGLKVIPHVKSDETKLSLKVFPGKAYIRGYEFETIAPTYIDLEKARDTTSKSGSVAAIEFGTYIFINDINGISIDFNNNLQIKIVDTLNTTIAFAHIYGIEKYTDDTYKLYIYNIEYQEEYNNISSAVSIANLAETWVADIDTSQYVGSIPSLTTGNYRSSIVKLNDDNVKSLLIGLNNASDTVYYASKSYSSQLTYDSGNDLYTISVTSINEDEQLYSNNVNDWIAVNTVSGAFYEIDSVTTLSSPANSKLLTLNLSSGTNGDPVIVFAKVAIASAMQKVKTLTTETLTGVTLTSGQMSLGIPDCYDLVTVTAYNAESEDIPSIDVTNRFSFNNGQTDDIYDHGWIQLKTGEVISPSYDTIDITFRYFSHSSTNGFFSVDSYPINDIGYENIPTFLSRKGNIFKLASCLDFRPIRAAGSTAISGSNKALVGSSVVSDYEYYLSRKDKLVLTKERKFKLIKGVPSVTPSVPSDEFDAMTLYILSIPAYTKNESAVSYTYIDNRRYTMRDIGKIDKRVKKLEYYTSLSLLEKQATDETLTSVVPGVERFKNGILVDSFSGHGIGACDNPDYKCAIDKESRILRPKFSSYSFDFSVDEIGQNTYFESDLIHLDYTTEIYINQPQASSWINVNPYNVFQWNGFVELDPPTDTWVDTHVLPDVIVNLNGENDVYTVINQDTENKNTQGVIWNDWATVIRGAVTNIKDDYSTETNLSTLVNEDTGERSLVASTNVTNTQTITSSNVNLKTGIEMLTSDSKTIQTNLGSKIVDTSIAHFVRPRTLQFKASKLKPNTRLYAIFDGIDVTKYCVQCPNIYIQFNEELASGLVNLTKVRASSNHNIVADVLSPSKFVFNRVHVQLDRYAPSSFAENMDIDGLVNGNWISIGTVTSIYTDTDTLNTDENGNISGFFIIPDQQASGIKFRSGEVLFRLSDAIDKSNASTAAEVKYIAQGLSQSVANTIVSTRVQTATIRAVNDIVTESTTTNNNIVTSNPEEGSTIIDITPIELTCGDVQISGGKATNQEYILNIGETVGLKGIRINPSNGIPVRYTVIWNGHEYTSGFIGDSSYDQKLLDLGYPKVSTNYQKSLAFTKNILGYPKGILRIESPISGSDWSIAVSCEEIPIPDPTYRITPSKTMVNGGESVTFTIETTTLAANTPLYWKVNSVDLIASDFSDNTLTGSVLSSSNGKVTFQKTINLSNELQIEPETFLMELYTQSNYGSGSLVATTSTITVIQNAEASFKIVSDKSRLVEDEIVKFTVTTTHIASGTVLYWKFVSSDFGSAVFSDNSISGSVTIPVSGFVTFQKTIKSGLTLSPTTAKLFKLSLHSADSLLPENKVTESNDVGITQTPQESYLIIPDKTLVYENQTVLFDVKTTGVPIGKSVNWEFVEYDWTNGGIPFTDGKTSGSFVIRQPGYYTVNGVSTYQSFTGFILSRTIKNNYISSGNHPEGSFKIKLVVSPTEVARSAAIKVARRPASTYSIVPAALSIKEGEAIKYTIVTTDVDNNTVLNWIFGTPTDSLPSGKVSATSGTVTIVNNRGTITINTRLDETLDEPDYKVTAVLRDGSGNVLATAATVTILDIFQATSAYNGSDLNLFFSNHNWKYAEESNQMIPSIFSQLMGQSKHTGSGWVKVKLLKSFTSTLNKPIKYRITSITSSDPRFKIYPESYFKNTFALDHFKRETIVGGSFYTFGTTRYTTYLPGTHPIFKKWPGTIYILNTPNEFSTFDWRISSSNPPFNINDETFRFNVVFNPFSPAVKLITDSGLTVENNRGYANEADPTTAIPNSGLGFNQLSPNNRSYTPPAIKTTLTFVAEYVSGDATIPNQYKTITKTMEIEYRFNSQQNVNIDPLAQSFFIDAKKHPNGIYLDSIDLFFKSKSPTIPVELQIRPMVNGYPSSTVILPFGSATLLPQQIQTSVDASVATNFKFKEIVHLSPGEYCFVVLSDTSEYEVFSAIIGDFLLDENGVQDLDKRILHQPTIGSLFKSQNASTWTAIQEEDLKFVMHKCVFDTSSNGEATFVIDNRELKGSIPFDVFFADGETVNFPGTSINYQAKIGNTTYENYQIGSNMALNASASLDPYTTDEDRIYLKTQFTSSDSDVTPIIDLKRLSSVLVKNIINNDVVDEDSPMGGNAFAKYITRTVKLVKEFESSDITVYLDAKKPFGTDVKVFYKVSPIDDPIFTDNQYHEMILDSSYFDKASGEFTEYKYVTPYNYDPANLDESSALPDRAKFDTFAIKVVLLSNDSTKIPEVKNLRAIAIDE